MAVLHTVAEMQGLYGPFTMSERVVQKIWLQQDFAASRATLSDGQPVEIFFPGSWNLLGGPDFKQARIRLGGREVTGDVEVHFEAADWTAHGHAANPAYADVVLHVLLFPPPLRGRPQRRADGSVIPALVLLPLLHRDLEEYAADDALEEITARDDWRRLEELANLPVEEIRARLRELALRRWRRKVAYGQVRLARAGWEEAAHGAALEILGYRHNRVPMAAVAERWPLASWRGGVALDAVLRSVQGWKLQGTRPANRPAARLAQYQAWVHAVPDWPSALRDAVIADGLGRRALAATERPLATREFRRREQLGHWRRRFAEQTGGAVGGPRLDTLVCDGFLPLLAATAGDFGLFEVWFNWFTGDVPDQIRRGLSKLRVADSPAQPLCHGYAQGLLGWLIEQEART
jgi:hypothetical protein